MEASLDTSTLKVALIVLVAAGVVIPLFHRLRISAVVGFMLVGAAVGPYSLGRLVEHAPWLAAVTVESPEAIAPVAQFGVVLLMFMIGLELSFERLWTMRRLVFGLGPAQVAGSTALLAAVLLALGVAAAPAVVLAVAGAMSSTAIVIQVLADQKRARGPGRAHRVRSAAVPGPVGGADPVHARDAGLRRSWRRRAAGAGRGAGGAGDRRHHRVRRLALRPLLRSVARTHSPDLFLAACLLLVLACALATEAAGLSMALGALIGGLLLAGTEYRRQVEVTIEPFKGLLLGVFLISVGMGLDFARVAAAPVAILGGAVALVALQVLVVAPLARAFGVRWAAALEAALLLGPAGEFSFVILAVAVVDRAAAAGRRGGRAGGRGADDGGDPAAVARGPAARPPCRAAAGQPVAGRAGAGGRRAARGDRRLRPRRPDCRGTAGNPQDSRTWRWIATRTGWRGSGQQANQSTGAT